MNNQSRRKLLKNSAATATIVCLLPGRITTFFKSSTGIQLYIDGRLPYDILLKETDPDLVKMGLDLFWATKAGHDPVKLFEASPGRYPLWHIKDMNDAGGFTEVGTGTLDFDRIFAAKKTAGMKQFYVEQDKIDDDEKKSVTTSYTNLQKII